MYGSMELAPLVGLADRIVDVVDTGNTLKANGLVPLEHIADISSRLVVNKAAMKMKHARITEFVAHLQAAVSCLIITCRSGCSREFLPGKKPVRGYDPLLQQINIFEKLCLK